MTGHRITLQHQADIRLKQALACAEVNHCDHCEDFKACQVIADSDVDKLFNHSVLEMNKSRTNDLTIARRKAKRYRVRR